MEIPALFAIRGQSAVLFADRGACGAEAFTTNETGGRDSSAALTNEIDPLRTHVPAFCDAAVTSPARVMRSHHPALKKALDGDPHMTFALK